MTCDRPVRRASSEAPSVAMPGGDGGADVGADGEAECLRKVDEPRVQRGQGGGDGGARRLRDQCEQRAEADELQAVDTVLGRQPLEADQRFQSGHAVLQRRDADEDEREARERETGRREAAAGEQPQQHADEDERQRQGRELQLEADGRDQPAGDRWYRCSPRR